MATEARTQVTVNISPTTALELYVLYPDNERYLGKVSAALESGETTIKFNYGWDTPAVIRAGIANLRAALDALEDQLTPATVPPLPEGTVAIPAGGLAENELRALHGDR